MGNKLGTVYQQIPNKTADYTVSDSDDLVTVDASGGAIVITLPTPVGRYLNADGRGRVKIVKTDSSANPVTVTPAAGSIVGQSVLRQQGQSAEYNSDGVLTWYTDGSPRQNIFQVRKTLAAADILAMNGSPVTLIPAPAAGKAIIVDNILFKMNRTATAFASGGALSFQYAGGATVTAGIAASVVTTGGAGTEYNNVRGVVTSLTPVQATAITITNATGAFTTGTGTADVIIDYHIAE